MSLEVAAVLVKYQPTTCGEGQYLFERLARFQVRLFPVTFNAEWERFIVDCPSKQNGSENTHVVLFQTWEISKRISRNAQKVYKDEAITPECL